MPIRFCQRLVAAHGQAAPHQGELPVAAGDRSLPRRCQGSA